LVVNGSFIDCSLPAKCAPGSTLSFPRPTVFTGADFLRLLPSLRNGLHQSLAAAGPGVQTLQVLKTSVSPVSINPVYVPIPSAQHFSVGVQHQIGRDFVVSADFVYRQFIHLAINPDLNHFDAAHGPVIPVCDAKQKYDPLALCSNGPINILVSGGTATYKGLLLRADTRFSRGFQILGSYAYSSNTGSNGTGSGTGFTSPSFTAR
jgi:hypothetical protein